MTKARKRAIRLGIILVLVAGAAFGGWKVWGGTAEEAPTGSPLPVRRGLLVESAAASGTIEPHVQVEVKSRGSGEVIEVMVEEGQTVQAGDLLFRLDPTDAERAVREARTTLRRVQAELVQSRASLSAAEVERENADANRDTSARGADLGLVAAETSRTAVATARGAGATVEMRRGQLAASQAQLEAARLAVDEAQRRLTETRIYAPMSGTALAVAIERGSIVSSALTNVSGGTALVTIADLSDLRVVGAIDEAQIGRVKVGQPVTIRVDAYPDRTFAGQVARVSPLGQTVTNVVTFDVEIVVDDPNASLLRSGMSADLEIETGRSEGALLVPLTAIQSVGPRRFVRLTSGERREVQTGATDGTRIAVTEGLKEGDTILIGGAPRPQAPSEGGSKSPLPMGGRRGPR